MYMNFEILKSQFPFISYIIPHINICTDLNLFTLVTIIVTEYVLALNTSCTLL